MVEQVFAFVMCRVERGTGRARAKVSFSSRMRCCPFGGAPRIPNAGETGDLPVREYPEGAVEAGAL